MCFAFVHAAIGTVGEIFATKIALVWPYTRMENQMSLQCFAPFKGSTAYITFILFGIRMNQLVHVESATSIKLQAADVAHVVVICMGIGVNLRRMTESSEIERVN